MGHGESFYSYQKACGDEIGLRGWLNQIVKLMDHRFFFHAGTVQVQSLSNPSRSQASENTKTVLDDDPDDDVWMGGLTSHGQIVRICPLTLSSLCKIGMMSCRLPPCHGGCWKPNKSWNRHFSQRSKENNKKWCAALAPGSSLRVLVLNHPISSGGNYGNWFFTLSNIK